MTALGAASEIRTRLQARARRRAEGVNTRSARPRGPRGNSGMTGPNGRTGGSGEGVCLGSLAEGVVLISNILHRARSVAPIRSAVVQIDTRPPEGASGPRRPGAKSPSEGRQDCRLGGRKLASRG